MFWKKEKNSENDKQVEIHGSQQSITDDGSEFVSVVAHQIRSPLASIRLVHQALLENENNNLTTEQIYLLEQADERANRIFNLTSNLLKPLSMEQSMAELNLVSGSIEHLLDEVLRNLTINFAEKHLQIHKQYDTNATPVMFDNEKLQDVVINILDNAIKYTPNNGQITVLTVYNDEQVSISITDTGIGVLNGDSHRLFEKFARMENAKSIDPNGLGLGLYIAQKIIEKHSGTLTHEANEPNGSTFTMNIPLSM